MAGHAHEDALSDAEFEKLVDGAKLLEPPWNLEAMYVDSANEDRLYAEPRVIADK